MGFLGTMAALPHERTSLKTAAKSVWCQQETHAPQQTASLVDHLVCASNQRRWAVPGSWTSCSARAAKTGAIGKARKAAVRDRRPASVSSLAHPATAGRR